jgi:small nuclear ribonucleoprotein (snRNP)-like protein
MKIKKILVLAIALSGFVAVDAQSNLKVVLNDGSELVGYISRQRPGEDFTFTSSKAVLTVPAQDVKSVVDIDVKYDSLSDEWKAWADENDAVVGVGDNRILSLSDIVTANGMVSHVRIIERGSKIKYLELSPNTHTLKWDDLVVVKCDKRPKMLLSGVNRKYKVTSGLEYEGQYVEEVPGQTLSLYRDNGVVEVFNTVDVVKDSRLAVNPNQSLLEQSDLIDIVELRNGETYKGIIFERDYFGFDDLDSIAVKKSNNKLVQHDYLLIQLEDESKANILLNDIVEYRKEKNDNYNPITDVILKEGEFMVNRNSAKTQIAEEFENTIRLNTDSVLVEINREGEKLQLAIESQFGDSQKTQQFKLVKADKYLDKTNKSYYYGFTYKNLAKDAILPSKSELSVNGTTKIDFDVKESGIFVFFNAITMEAVPFRIQ